MIPEDAGQCKDVTRRRLGARIGDRLLVLKKPSAVEYIRE